MLSLGIIGEYVGSIYTHVRKRPYVIERERVNFGRSSEEDGGEVAAALPFKRRAAG
jgi:hypothetical protein